MKYTKLLSVLSVLSGGEEIPTGGWRGGEEIPTGGWRGGEEIPTGGWRDVAIIGSDNYRTKDGDAYFAFSFFQKDKFVETDVTFFPNSVSLLDVPLMCIESERGGYTLISQHKARDIFTAKLIAGEWAEKIWVESQEHRSDIK